MATRPPRCRPARPESCELLRGRVSTSAAAPSPPQKFDERADVKAIKDEIKKAFPDHKPITDGYPDMGSGLFGQLLKPAEWYEFNLAQRAHHNTLEFLTFAITMVLTAGLFQPEAAAACGVVFCIGRVMLARGYTRLGPNGRFPGGPISMIPMMGLLGVNLFYGFKHGLIGAGAISA